MILILAGAAETTQICQMLLPLNLRVFVSTATENAINLPASEMITRICGRKNLQQLCSFIKDNDIRLLVCAVHPYASAARETAMQAARECAIPAICYIRKSSDLSSYSDMVNTVRTHEQAAELACRYGKNIFLTTGSNNLGVYQKQAQISGCNIFARILECAESRKAIDQSGVEAQNIIYGRGPFSAQRNIEDIRRCNGGVLVTKDGGAAGGLYEKLDAARELGVKVILVQRPEFNQPHHTDLEQLATDIFSRLEILTGQK